MNSPSLPANERAGAEVIIQFVADNIKDVEELGDLESSIMLRISQLLSKSRTLTDATLPLFTRSLTDTLTLPDCAKLSTESLLSIATFSPNLRHLALYHAGSANDEVLDYYADKLHHLTSFHFHGAFLVSQPAYHRFFAKIGGQLKHLTLANSRNNEALISTIVDSCPHLESLNLSHLTRLDDASIGHLQRLTNLTSLDISHSLARITDASLVPLLNTLGSGLTSLSLSGCGEITAKTTSAIHACCASLRELDLSDCESLEPEDVANLFTNWTKNRGLRVLKLKHVPLSDDALLALALHSAKSLEEIDLTGADVTKDALVKAIELCRRGDDQSTPGYASYYAQDGGRGRLAKVNVDFVRAVDDEVVEALVKEAGARRVVVWGCNRVTECVERVVEEVGVGRVNVVGREVVGMA